VKDLSSDIHDTHEYLIATISDCETSFTLDDAKSKSHPAHHTTKGLLCITSHRIYWGDASSGFSLATDSIDALRRGSDDVSLTVHDQADDLSSTLYVSDVKFTLSPADVSSSPSTSSPRPELMQLFKSLAKALDVAESRITSAQSGDAFDMRSLGVSFPILNESGLVLGMVTDADFAEGDDGFGGPFGVLGNDDDEDYDEVELRRKGWRFTDE
jgi:hypothetical protein